MSPTTDTTDAREPDVLDPIGTVIDAFFVDPDRVGDDDLAEATPRGHVRVPREGPLSPEQSVEALRRALERGVPWYPALLEVIARWTAPAEQIDGEPQTYLIAGEAFDWLLLAQRLLDEVADLVPVDEAEQLLVHGIAPDGSDEDDFEQAIGAAKHRAHLNFQYGVVVEELLLLAVELELVKSGTLSGAGRPAPDLEAFEHVYGKPLDELKLLYGYELGRVLGDRMSQSELQAFTYWLSKYRVRTGEPARVASDTKKAMAMMSRLEAGRARLGRLHAAQARAGRVVETDTPRRAAPPQRKPRPARNGPRVTHEDASAEEAIEEVEA
ncbi:MAG: hypothetical protein WCL53_08200 [Chloroflexota bacterium]